MICDCKESRHHQQGAHLVKTWRRWGSWPRIYLGRKYYRHRENRAQRPRSGNMPGVLWDQRGGEDGWNEEHKGERSWEEVRVPGNGSVLGLWIIMRNLTFTLSNMKSHWRVLSISDLCFKKITLGCYADNITGKEKGEATATMQATGAGD